MKRNWLAGAAALVMIAAACSGDDDVAVTTSVETTAPPTTVASTNPTTTDAVVPTTEPANDDVVRMPLTGEPIDDASEIPDRPALVVKLTNAGPQPRPQAGLNSADLVIEEVINDSVSRLAAVFHSQDTDPVGPVRSGRAQDVDVMLAFDRPLFAWSGGNPSVNQAVRESDLIDLSAIHTGGYYRRQSRISPNNLYSSTEVLWDHTNDDAGRPSPVFSYADVDAEIEGESATTIDVQFDGQRVRWEYDAETDGYYRFQDGAEHNTEETDAVERVWTKNVVVMLADYGVNTFDGNPDAQVLGSNPAYVFTGGVVQEGVWLRFEPTDPFEMFDDVDDGDPLELQPGRAWLEIPRNVDGTLEWE